MIAEELKKGSDMDDKKVKLACYWACGCGGCDVSILDTDLKVLDLAAAADIVFWPIAVDFKEADVEALPDGSIDLCLFNGSIRNEENLSMALLLRKKSRVLVAFGTCAYVGGIHGLINTTTTARIMETVFSGVPSMDNPERSVPLLRTTLPEGSLSLPRLFDTVRSLDQVVEVDYYVPGCPPAASRVGEIIDVYLSGSMPPRGTVLGASMKALCDTCPRQSSGAAYAFARGWEQAYGYYGVNAMYALVARRHMHLYGTTQDHLGQIAVAQRKWANLNPAAQMHDQPLTLEDYHRSRWIVEPFHLFDCCLVSNGGCAVIVTSAERAQAARKPPVYLWGMAQGHLGGDPADTLASGAVLAKEPAFGMAEITLGDLDVVELYDCYTFTVLVTLEDYGFCKKGEGGPFVAGGRIAPGGSLPVNTGGGQLSSFYMWGMTPISEGIIQIRGEGGARQVPDAKVALVSGNGGILSTHSTLVLGREA